MSILANALVSLVALIHIIICYAEMFQWRQPFIHKMLGYDKVRADAAADVVKNAGLFNGFLAVGLLWGLIGAADPVGVKTFFLGFIIVAGVFGAVTLRRWAVALLQSLPAGLALAAVWAAR